MPPSEKAAVYGEPSHVWRAGQDRRLKMILAAMAQAALPDRTGRILENGCGVGVYVEKLRQVTPLAVFGLEYDFTRARHAGRQAGAAVVVCGTCEHLPYPPDAFDVIISNEVIEHVRDDRQALVEMARVLRPGGRLVLFCPNRWYPVETHGIYWRGRYCWGNIPLVNYLPNCWRNHLAPHVRAYTAGDLRRLFTGLPLHLLDHTRIFGGYDNIIARWGTLGRLLRTVLYLAENTPLKVLGLSHLVVAEKVEPPAAAPSA